MTQSQQPLNVLEVLDGVSFPAMPVELIAYAEDQDASEDVLYLLHAIPEREYHSIADVNRSIGLIEKNVPGHENLWSSEPAEELDEVPAEVAALSITDRVSSLH